MNKDFRKKYSISRLSTEEQDTLEKIYTDHCRGERAQEGIKDILDEIRYYGEIGGTRL